MPRSQQSLGPGLLLAGLVLSTPGCPADSKTDTDTASTSGTSATTDTTGTTGTTDVNPGTTNGAALDPCECVLFADGGLDSAPTRLCPENLCVLELACANDTGDATGPGEPGECTVDQAALDCALNVLISGTFGRVHYGHSPDGGFSGSGGFILVREDRRAVTREFTYLDLGGDQSEAAVRELKSAAYFEGCQALPTSHEVYECLIDAVTGDALAVCAEAGPYSV